MVVHDLTHREAVRQADRVLHNKHIEGALTAALGMEAVTSMRNKIVDVAAGYTAPVELHMIERGLRHVRLALTFGALGFSLKTGVTQLLGLGVAIGEFGLASTAKGIADFYSNPFANGDFIKDKSVYMRDRISTMNRDVNAVMRHLAGGSGAWNTLKEKSFMFLLAGDLAVSWPVWWAAYHQGLDRVNSDSTEDAGFKTEQDAINWADRAVARTQQSGMLMDLSGVEQQNELLKMWTVMYSAFSAIYNMSAEQFQKARMGKIDKVEYTWNMLWIIVIPALLDEMMTGFDDDDDDDSAFGAGAEAIARYSLALMIGLRDVSWLMRSGQGSQLPFQRFIKTPFEVNRQLQQGEMDSALIRSLTDLASLAHVPGGSQLNRSLQYWLAVQEGDEQGFNPWEALVTGPRDDADEGIEL